MLFLPTHQSCWQIFFGTIVLFTNLMSESVEGEALVAGDGGALVVVLPGG